MKIERDISKTRPVAVLVAILVGYLMSPALEWRDSLRYVVAVEAASGGGTHTPFWMVANRQGLPYIKKQGGIIRGGVFHDLDTARRFSWGAGLDLATGWNSESPFRIQQLYGEVKYRCLDLMVGQKEMWGYGSDALLGSGNIVYSGNSRPIPQIKIGIFDYADVWGCKGWFGMKGYLSFGKFTDSGWQKKWVAQNSGRIDDALYHSKGIWFRIGNEKKYPFTYEFGLEMATQFGGTAYMDGKSIKLPNGWKDWIKAVIPLSGGEDVAIDGERTNVQGNMLGAWYTNVTWSPAHDWKLRLYYQHLFEDHSMMFWEYPWKDGLWGVQIDVPRNPYITSAVIEFFYTKDQAGPVNHDREPLVPEQVSGRDGYYNNYLYCGWQQWGYGIGNPLLISPIYNKDHQLFFPVNRNIMWHFGCKGSPHPEIGYVLKLTHISSWGSYYIPFREVKHNFSGYLELQWRPRRFKGWTGSIALAGDAGDIIGNSMGASIGISKTGFFLKKMK